MSELIALGSQVPKGPLSLAHGQRLGNHRSQIRGRGMEFSETRNYQAGDDIRHMEWRVTARTGRPHVKIYQEERERPVFLLVDFNPSMTLGTRLALKSVVAARLAALLAWSFIQQGDRVGGFFFSALQHSEWVPKAREAGILPLLASLSHFTKAILEERHLQAQPLHKALLRLRRVLRPGSLVILLSDFYTLDAACEEQLKLIRTHNDILAYRICDVVELAPPKPQAYPLGDGEQSSLVDLRVDAIYQAYQGYCDSRLQEIIARCRSLQIHCEVVTAETNLSKVLRLCLPRRRHGQG